MSLLSNDICLLEIDDFNLYEEGTTNHATSSLAAADKPSSSVAMEAEKRIRREIANSNERRRMQSINAGFQSLRTLLPRHEGEKLSKAAILQQTAEYIYSLEQEKTRLLSQNCQLKRLLNQHEGGEIPLKKRKNDSLIAAAAIIPDSTEDLTGNPHSPEPVAMISVTTLTPKKEPSEANELKLQLDREMRMRMFLEERVRTLESQMYPESAGELSHQMTLHYEDATDTDCPQEPLRAENLKVEERESLQVVSVESLPPVGEHRTVGESRSPSPRIPPLLEAAIKAEPRVEVEVLPDARSPASPSRLYLASTSRQNLETIVEAIRHLEGDHLFGEEAGDLPLALTKKPEQRLLQVEPFLQFAGGQRQTRPGVIVVKHS